MKKVAVITGGAVNIGAAISKKLALNGFRVAVVYNSSSNKANAIVKEIIQKGGCAESFRADISNENDVVKLFKEIENNKNFGRVDVLVNNSGIFTIARQIELSAADWRRLFDVNVTGTFLCCREAIKMMNEQKLVEGCISRGSIINTASINAFHPGFGQTAHYDASKGAVLTYTKTLAAELGYSGIRVNSISPGLVDSGKLRKYSAPLAEMVENRNPLKKASGGCKLVEADDVAETVLFLAGEKASAITGTNIVIDRGYLLS